MANSVTARFNDDCKVFVSMSDDTTVEKAVIIDAEGNETDIGGGGGDSDFSTAKLTLNGNPINTIYVPITSEEDSVSASFTQLPNQGGTFDVILYKGNAVLTTTQTITTSGNIEKLTDNVYLITGDCTITITII